MTQVIEDLKTLRVSDETASLVWTALSVRLVPLVYH
jgi:hypothetical protein